MSGDVTAMDYFFLQLRQSEIAIRFEIGGYIQLLLGTLLAQNTT